MPIAGVNNQITLIVIQTGADISQTMHVMYETLFLTEHFNRVSYA